MLENYLLFRIRIIRQTKLSSTTSKYISWDSWAMRLPNLLVLDWTKDKQWFSQNSSFTGFSMKMFTKSNANYYTKIRRWNLNVRKVWAIDEATSISGDEDEKTHTEGGGGDNRHELWKNNNHGILTRFTNNNWMKKWCFSAAGWAIKTVDWCFRLLCSKSNEIVWNVGGTIITHTIRIMDMEVSIAELLMVFVNTVRTKRNI